MALPFLMDDKICTPCVCESPVLHNRTQTLCTACLLFVCRPAPPSELGTCATCFIDGGGTHRCSGCHLFHHTAISEDRSEQCGLHPSQFLPRASGPWMCPTCYRQHAAALYEEQRERRFTRGLLGPSLGVGVPSAAPALSAVTENLPATEAHDGAGPSHGRKRPKPRDRRNAKAARVDPRTRGLTEGGAVPASNDVPPAAPALLAVAEIQPTTEAHGVTGHSLREEQPSPRGPRYRKAARVGPHTPGLPEGAAMPSPIPLAQHPPPMLVGYVDRDTGNGGPTPRGTPGLPEGSAEPAPLQPVQHPPPLLTGHVDYYTGKVTLASRDTPMAFPWSQRLVEMGRGADSVGVLGDGNCMLHAWLTAPGAPTHATWNDVNVLRNLICQTLRAATPASTWRRDYHFDMQDLGNSDYEAEQWDIVVAMAEPYQHQAPYLREVHTRALAIATGTTIVALSMNSMVANTVGGANTYQAPDLITVFLPDPDSGYEGVRTEMAASSRSGPVFKTHPGNKYTWAGFKSIWDRMPGPEKRACRVIVYDGGRLHYEGTTVA
jgi:hypothetical protein